MKKLTTARLIVPAGGESADLLYATGFAATDPVVYLHGVRGRFMVVPLLELGRARHTARGVVVFAPQHLPIAKKNRRRLAWWALGLLRKVGETKVAVDPMFPAGVLRELERRGICVMVTREPCHPQRPVKTAAEIAHLRRAQRAAAAAMRAAVQVIARARVDRRGVLRAGRGALRSEDVRRVIDRVLLDHDCVARETIVACGPAGADPHARGTGPLRAGAPIVLDIFPRHRGSGYWGDLTRTVCRGPVPPTLRRMYAAVRRAHREACAMIRAGVAGASVHRRVEETLAGCGFPSGFRDGRPYGFIHSTGHGIGLEIHEAPALGASGPRLRAGNVVTVEPGLYDPAIGGVRIEDVVVVTARGARRLAALPARLEV